MKTRYDPEVDALYLRFSDSAVTESEEVRPGIVFDFDAEGRLVGLEILDASEHVSSGTDLPGLNAA